MTTWTPATQQAETWIGGGAIAGTWATATTQTEAWAAKMQAIRVFDPYVFANEPIFDTGTSAGVWAKKAEQVEIWTSI